MSARARHQPWFRQDPVAEHRARCACVLGGYLFFRVGDARLAIDAPAPTAPPTIREELSLETCEPSAKREAEIFFAGEKP